MSEEKEVLLAPNENEKKKPGCFKGCLTFIIIFIIFGALIGACFGDETPTEDVNSTNEPADTSAKSSVNKQESKEKDTTDSSKPSADEVGYYKNELGPELDAIQKEYDRIWNEQWITTFNRISDGSVNVYDAYKTMTFIETNYTALSKNIKKIESNNLSKENNKLLEEYTSKLKKASDYRSFAASEAAKMFDNGDFKPSEFESIKNIVSMSDNEMLSAIVNRVSIESNLGLIETTE